MKIAIVAGEASGDILAAGLISELKSHYPDAEIYGIAGDLMVAAGCRRCYPMETLSVMGLAEVLGRLREILRVRRAFYRQLLASPPDVFIGVDAPDFNLGLELKLRRRGIKTVHYVSPSVWAWRQRRVKKIARAVDLMLSLFPFEQAFYEAHRVNVCYVGHPLADQIPFQGDKQQARDRLGLAHSGPLVGLLPGSRRMEVERLAEVFLHTARECHRRCPQMHFVIPVAGADTAALLESRLQRFGQGIPVTLVQGNARLVMQAADYLLLASGTATLEACLAGRPMVVAYRMSALSYWIMKVFRLVKVEFFSLPNLLSGKPVVEEYLQQQVTVEKLSAALFRLIEDSGLREAMCREFHAIHRMLRLDASKTAAQAVVRLLQQSSMK